MSKTGLIKHFNQKFKMNRRKSRESVVNKIKMKSFPMYIIKPEVKDEEIIHDSSQDRELISRAQGK